MRLWCSGPILLLAVSAAAEASPPQAERQPPRPEQPPARIWRAPPGPMQGGRFGLPLAGNVQVGVGRFSVLEPARPRTHTEPIARGAEIGRRSRGIAAVGVSLRF
jgi:hypothetical protein